MKTLTTALMTIAALTVAGPAFAVEASASLSADMTAADTDKSGGLSLTEMTVANADIKETDFTSMDLDASGEINMREMVAFGLSNPEMPTADTDKSGGVSYTELVAVLPDIGESEFNQTDVDGDGQLNGEEFVKFASSAKQS